MILMPPEKVAVLNRIGLSIGFVSFWFAAPEFIGEKRLQSWEQDLARVLSRFNRLPKILKGIALAIPLLAIYSGLASLNKWTSLWVPHPTAHAQHEQQLVGVVIGAAVSVILANLDSVVKRLADDPKVRQRALFLGAALFTLAFVIQLIATF